MTNVYASGQWHVHDGQEEEFIRRWHDYVSWGQQVHGEGFKRGRLLRDEHVPTQFVSFLEWDAPLARDRWRYDPELPSRLSRCEELCREVRTAQYEAASAVGQ